MCSLFGHKGGNAEGSVCEDCYYIKVADCNEARALASLYLAQLHVRGIKGIGWENVEWLSGSVPPNPEANDPEMEVVKTYVASIGVVS